MDLKCHCGKLIGRYRNGKFYLYCKNCKKEIEINPNEVLENSFKNTNTIKINKVEPKSQDK